MGKPIVLSEEIYQRLFGIKESEGHTSIDSVIRTLLLRVDSTILLRSREEIQIKQQELKEEHSKYKSDAPYSAFIGGIIQGMHYILYPYAVISMTEGISKSKKEDLKDG